MPTVYLKVEISAVEPGVSLAPGSPVMLGSNSFAIGPAVIIEAPRPPGYMVELQQSGGCDYTIGCGLVTESLDATSEAEAIAEVTEMIRENHSHAEGRIDSATLYAVVDVIRVDVKGIYQAIAAEQKAALAAEKERKERAEFDRLQKKYGVTK